MASAFPVLLVDDGELDDVRDLLVELGVEFAHLRGGAVPKRQDPPHDLFVATARHACLASHWAPDARGPGLPIRIAVVQEDSVALRGSLRRQGFTYLVRRPVHPVALRLLLTRALYRGEERRGESRVAVGREVEVRWRMRRRKALLADLSPGGCRLLCDRPLPDGAKITIEIPGEEEVRVLSLPGRVLRSEPDQSSGERTSSVAVGFTDLSDELREHLRSVLAAQPITAVEATEPAPFEPRVIQTVVDSEPAARSRDSKRPRAVAAAPKPVESDTDRRRNARVHYERRVFAAADALHRVLIGRDLSVGGMRIDPHPDLEVGARLRVALYDPAREKPLVVDAVVARDDAKQGLALLFDQPEPTVAGCLERLVANLPPVECLADGEAGALGTVVGEIVP